MDSVGANELRQKGRKKEGIMKKIIKVEALADMHAHPREVGEAEALILYSLIGGADVLGVMPNTVTGLTTARRVLSHIKQLKEGVLGQSDALLVPFVMITEQTKEQDIDNCVNVGIVNGKVYPYLRTTQSGNGVRRYGKILPIIKHCGKVGMKVHFHPEHPSMLFGNRDAEFVFLPIARISLEETDAYIFWEHGSDARCIPHWEEMARSQRFFVTLTAHHLATNEDETFGDVRSVCKPPIKTEYDRQGLVDLVAKDYEWVMAGGDSAFHDRDKKQVIAGCCACGAFTAPFLMPLYAHALDKLLETAKGIQTFINFTSRNARKVHGLPEASRELMLFRESEQIPLSYPIGVQSATPFWAGQFLNWKIVG